MRERSTADELQGVSQVRRPLLVRHDLPSVSTGSKLLIPDRPTTWNGSI
jgi:hypothetical protein